MLLPIIYSKSMKQFCYFLRRYQWRYPMRSKPELKLRNHYSVTEVRLTARSEIKINANSKTNKIKAFYLVLQQNVNHRSQSFTDIPMSRPIGRKSKQSCKAKSAKSRVTQSKVKRKKRSSWRHFETVNWPVGGA